MANQKDNLKKGLSVAGEVAKSVIKSKDFSVKGVAKGIRKATGKKRGVFGKFKDELFDDLGIYDIQDTFIEFGNDIRETFGLKPKMTNEERLELEEKEERKKEQQKAKGKRDLEKQKNAAFDEQVEAQKEEIKLERKIEEEHICEKEQQSQSISIGDSEDIQSKKLSENKIDDECKKDTSIEKNGFIIDSIKRNITICAAIIIIIIAIIIDATDGNSSLIQLISCIVLIVASCVRKNYFLIDYVFGVLCSLLIIKLSNFLNNGSLIQLCSGVILVIITVKYLKTIGKMKK